MENSTQLPTSYTPVFNRNNWHYWIKLSNGTYSVTDRCKLEDCVIMFTFCQQHGIPFKATPISEENHFGMELASYLTCFI